MARSPKQHRPCSVAGCENHVKTRGWCTKHYSRWQRTGDPLGLLREPVTTIEPRDLGISYRQLDFWARQGYLRPVRSSEGTGHWRDWPEQEQAVARDMGLLTRAGLSAGLAHRIAREGRTEAVLTAIGPAA